MRKPRQLLSPIAIRLGLASLGIALGAIALVVGLTLYSARGDVSSLVQQQQEATAATTAKAVADAWRVTGSWKTADLLVPATLAAHSEAHLTVLDERGLTVPVPAVPNDTRPRVITGPLLSSPVVVHGRRVGRALLHFYGVALPVAEATLRDALIGTVAQSAGVAALLALAVAVLFSRRITRPVTALTRAVRSFEAGNHQARVGGSYAKGELIELTASFDRLADTITREEDLRRAVMADVAHELRTPLSVLQATTESLVDEAVAPTPETLSSLHDEVLRLGRVVDDLNTLASAEAANLHMDLQPVDVAEHVESAVHSLEQRFREAGVHLIVDLVHARAVGDPHRIEQIAFNLLSNALKFTGYGGTVIVRVRDEGGTVVLDVIDTGIGIPTDELPHVFDRFWRGREAGRLAGSGIGLAVVRALVDAQAATIRVESEPAQGSRFSVTIPAPTTDSVVRPPPKPVVLA